jgi:ArsR family transcriptional regulator
MTRIKAATPICQHESHAIREGKNYPPEDIAMAAAMCKALSDPARLRLLLWLISGERCVSELVELEDEKLSTISARLQLLSNARLVTKRRESKHIYYSLADEHVRSLIDNVLHHAAEFSA